MDSSLYAYLTGAGMAAIGWALRTIYQKLVAQDQQLSDLKVGHAELKVTLLGVNGMNGINGTVKLMDEKMDDLAKRLEQAGA
jgi:UDP-N-acetylmuramyl tripeptide synthase